MKYTKKFLTRLLPDEETPFSQWKTLNAKRFSWTERESLPDLALALRISYWRRERYEEIVKELFRDIHERMLPIGEFIRESSKQHIAEIEAGTEQLHQHKDSIKEMIELIQRDCDSRLEVIALQPIVHAQAQRNKKLADGRVKGREKRQEKAKHDAALLNQRIDELLATVDGWKMDRTDQANYIRGTFKRYGVATIKKRIGARVKAQRAAATARSGQKNPQ